jgi:UDP-glucose 4-epimerase
LGNCFSPYGTTKYVSELLLRDLHFHQWFSALNLRYFNPIGAHSSWLLGEDPAQSPTNLLPVIFQVLQWKRPYLEIFGETYDTPDGTCLRDYIHVVDLAEAHVAGRKRLENQQEPTLESINVWTGTPTSVKELVAITQEVTTQSVEVRIVDARPWDVPVAYAQTKKAHDLLWWSTKKSVFDAVHDWWRFITT